VNDTVERPDTECSVAVDHPLLAPCIGMRVTPPLTAAHAVMAFPFVVSVDGDEASNWMLCPKEGNVNAEIRMQNAEIQWVVGRWCFSTSLL